MKEFSKFQIASIKRTAQNVYPLVRRKEKLLEQIKECSTELEELQAEIDGYQFPISKLTGGYTTEDLVVRNVIDTGKKDKSGNPIKITKYDLKYPETIIPTTVTTSESSTNVVEEEENIYSAQNESIEAPINEPFNI